MIVAGIGCRKGASADDIGAVIADALARAGFAPEALDLIATPELKCDEHGVAVAAAALGVPLLLIAKADLKAACARAENPLRARPRSHGDPLRRRSGGAGRRRPYGAADRAADRDRARDLRARR
jgi:hypothetical protein